MAARAGAKFAVSPGFSSKLLTAASVPLLPGVATAGETMAAAEAGCMFLKLFPAQAAGGFEMLKALHGPFPELRFCPTGGVTAELAPTYLSLPNVICVGGS
jgi:2-dehydro-3-deoxyphosphogluconate aldolase/(4S)-4-hydroxy-2-oxoglutarate aldolase